MAWSCRRCQRVYADPPAEGRCPHDGGELVPMAEARAEDEHTGRVCDEKYKVGRLLGAGGMGCVHEAVNLRLDQPVAVKFFSPRFVSSGGTPTPADVERFRREATVMARLRHPNIAEVLDFSIEPDGTMYIVMELLDGVSLEAALRRGDLTVKRGLEIALTVLRTLAYVHSQGVIHRDLKPANVFCAREAGRETIKLLDFGIARIADLSTITHGPVGTWRFAAPEQLAGDKVAPAADVFSAGVILHQMLAGGLPGERPLGDDVPGALRDVVAKAMATDPLARYAHAGEMAEALDAAAARLSEKERARPLASAAAAEGLAGPGVPGPVGEIASGATPAFTPAPLPRTATGAVPGETSAAPPRAGRATWILAAVVAVAVLAVAGVVYFSLGGAGEARDAGAADGGGRGGVAAATSLAGTRAGEDAAAPPAMRPLAGADSGIPDAADAALSPELPSAFDPALDEPIHAKVRASKEAVAACVEDRPATVHATIKIDGATGRVVVAQVALEGGAGPNIERVASCIESQLYRIELPRFRGTKVWPITYEIYEDDTGDADAVTPMSIAPADAGLADASVVAPETRRDAAASASATATGYLTVRTIP